jgi:hypothetical protein
VAQLWCASAQWSERGVTNEVINEVFCASLRPPDAQSERMLPCDGSRVEDRKTSATRDDSCGWVMMCVCVCVWCGATACQGTS